MQVALARRVQEMKKLPHFEPFMEVVSNVCAGCQRLYYGVEGSQCFMSLATIKDTLQLTYTLEGVQFQKDSWKLCIIHSNNGSLLH